MQAMIFAAGLGTRLKPFTHTQPKALAPLANSTLLMNALRYLSDQGFTRLVINTHHHASRLEAYIEKIRPEIKADILISREDELLDTAGGLKKAQALFIPDMPVALYNVDVVTDLNIRKMWSMLRREDVDAVLAVRQRNTSRYLLFHSDGMLAGWRNVMSGEEIITPRGQDVYLAPLAFSGVHIVNYDIFDMLQVRKESLVPFYLRVCQQYKIKAFNHSDSAWFDCGTPEKLERATKWIQSRPH